MIDGGLIVGYLTAALLRGGQRWLDRSVDGLLDRLTGMVASRLGRDPIDRLEASPRDETVHRELGLTLDGALRANPDFARELERVVAELDRRGGREILNQVQAQTNIQAFDHGIAVGGDFNYFHTPDPSDLSGSPLWVKLCVVLGAGLCITGLAIFGFTFFTDLPALGDPDFGEIPSGVPFAFGVFFVGFVFVGIGSLGRSLSGRR